MSEEIQKIIREIQSLFKGYEIYLVGGTVRDLLLNRKISDLDFCTNAHPQEIKTLLNKFSSSVYNIGEKFGTIGCLKDNLEIQITTYRSDLYDSISRKPKVAFESELLKDLSRRDFKINSLAWDGKTFIDPYQGLKDLKDKVITFTGNPEERIKEDPLRMLRAIRLASQLDFSLPKETFSAILKNSQELRRVSAERVATEIDKILLSAQPAQGIRLFYRTNLYQGFLPLDLMEIEQPQNYHHKNVLEHTLLLLEKCPPNLITRWAGLLHDLGKAETRTLVEGEVHFYGHEEVSARLGRKVLRKLRYSNDFINKVSLLVRSHMYVHGYGREGVVWSDGAVRRLIRKMGELFPNFLNLIKADITSSRPEVVEACLRRVKELEERIEKIKKEEEVEKIKCLLDGNEIMEIIGISPSKLVGEVKDFVFQRQLDRGKSYTKEQAIEDVRDRFG